MKNQMQQTRLSKAFFLLIVMSIGGSIANGQIRRVGGGQPPDFDAEKVAGIYTYDTKDVIKKLKVTDKETKSKVSEAILVYNQKVGEVAFVNAALFERLEREFDRQVQVAMRNRDPGLMSGFKAQVQQVMPPIKMEVKAYEVELNASMKAALDGDQFGKWLKFQKRKRPEHGAQFARN